MNVRAQDIRAFLLLCVIWGSTWVAVKAGLESAPPLFLAGSRFTIAGVVLCLPGLINGTWRIARRHWSRLAAAALLIMVLCYSCLFWGMLYVDSGTAAVIEMGLTPVALLAFALVAGEERASYRKVLSIALGLLGLALLFGSTVRSAWASGGGDSSMKLLGTVAVASAAVTYSWGSILLRPLLRIYPASVLSSATTLIGGSIILMLSFALEPEARTAMHFSWTVRAWAGWLFLIIFGSLIAYTLYMRLLRDIGPSRAGMYAFVSPVIAVGLGAATRGERVGASEAIGMVVLLGAAWLAMGVREVSTPKPETGTNRTSDEVGYDA